MLFSGAGSADQHGVALLGKEGSARQIADQRLVDRRAGEVEVGQRQLGDGQLIFDRAPLTLLLAAADREDGIENADAGQNSNGARRHPSSVFDRHHDSLSVYHSVSLRAKSSTVRNAG
jgi:hypothetical protein